MQRNRRSRTAIGDKETILAHQEQFYVRPKRMKEGVFYHFTPDKKLTAEGLLSGTAKRFDTQLGPGLYVGQDAQALKNFYGLDMRSGQAVRLEGNPKILDLTDSFKFVDDAHRAARKEFPKEKYPLGKWVQKQGYDGIKYFDPIATGEEYVIYNAKAFGGKPSEALKATIPKFATRKELDKTFENIPDFVKKRYPNAETGRRILEEGYERGLVLSKQAENMRPNAPVTSYHGTTRTSAEAIRKSGFKVPEAETFAESGGRKYGEGVYLQPAKEDAITSSLFYGKRADPKGMGADLAVLETEFIPKKPFVINSPRKFMPFGSNEWGAFIHKIIKEPTINDSITAYLKNRPARLKVDAALRKAGYDSVVLKAEGKADLVVALNPRDVKITNIYKDADGSLETFRKGYQKAFRDATNKPASVVEELKASAKAEIPTIKGAKAIDLSQPAKAAQPSKIQEIIGEYQKRINTTPAKKAATPIKKTLDETYTAIIDRFHPITKLARKASELRPGENPELLSRRYLGVQGIAESKLFWNTTRLTAEGNLEVTGPGLSKILKPAKNNIDDLRTLMIAERDIELSQRILESGKKVIGTTPEQSKQVINALKKKYGDGFAQLSKTALGVRDWSRKALLDPLLEVGAISKEQYDTIAKSNKFYVPFQRVIEELETHGFVPKKANIFSPRSVPVKKLKGSTKDIIDPFESMITNAYKVTDFVERARVGRSITNLRNTSPELAEMIKPTKPKLVPVAKQGEELIFRPSFFTPDKNTIMVFENGKRKFYQVPEDVFKAVSGMMESDVGAIMKVLAFPARTLRAGATLTPEFMGRNPFRDQFTAFVFSKYGYVPGVDLVKGIFNTVGKTDLHGRWLAGGGAHSMLVSLDRVTSQATLAKVLGSKDVKGLVKNPIEALRILSEFGEKGTRVGAFGRAVKKGASDLEAAFESRDITLDFARRGSQTRAVNMLVAFWNAQVQGLNKTVRAFRERPMQTTFKAASGITLPSVLLYLNNRNDPRYQELPQWQKDLFWIIPVGDDGPIIRIPKPFEVGIVFGTVPEHILTWLDKNDPEALTSAAKTLMEASAPGYIPTGLQPIIENIANYSFFRQRPIVSEGKQALPKELQADRYTSETAKEVGKLIKQSPAKIENLFVSYTGGLGKYALDASDKLLKTLGVVSPPSEPAKTLADRPFIRAFVAREPIGSGSESVNKFYKFYDEANQTKAAVKGLAEEGKETEAVNYLRSHPAGFYTKGLNKVARTFSDLRKKRDAVLDSRELNPEQKKRAIDALDKIMTEIARQTVELVGTSNEKFRQ
ncbi:MAG: LPD38 domain-containing protein [bacterium]|nr:LPD38 domain-containing protein [bacterium]